MSTVKLKKVSTAISSALAIVLLSSLALPAFAQGETAPATKNGGTHANAEDNTAGDSATLNSVNDIKNWFAQYDQIRRDAELSIIDKLQVKSFLDKNIEHGITLRKRDADLATRMSQLYEKAYLAMRDLHPLQSTQELQTGYTEYFKKVEHIFKNYVKTVSSNNSNCSNGAVSAQAVRTELEELDVKNKKIDAALRLKYGIAKHNIAKT